MRVRGGEEDGGRENWRKAVKKYKLAVIININK